MELLKGNYKVSTKEKLEPAKESEASIESRFEESAMEKLGGSIAFVKKSAFLWKGK